MAFIEAEISAENITEAMNRDPNFAYEMWCELASKLHMGLLMDNACDLFASATSDDARIVAGEFSELAERINHRRANP